MGIAAVAGTGVHTLSTVSHIYNLNTISHVAQIAHGAGEVQIGKALARVAENATAITIVPRMVARLSEGSTGLPVGEACW